jgi:predicted flap endonuclease-1-like 5' DNA nuclease
VPYTLVKGLAWVVLALLMGGVIGWLLRNLTSRRQIAKARSGASGVSAPESPAVGSMPADIAELERLRLRLAELEPIVVERDRLRGELDSVRRGRPRAVPWSPGSPSGASIALEQPPSPDVTSATAVLGRTIALDDLTVVVGVGTVIESLCHGIGIRTWWDLATTETSLLRTMLRDAGGSVAGNDPTSWPEQARLLAEGRWTEFRVLADAVAAGRPSD